MSINQFILTGRVGHIHQGDKFMRVTVYPRAKSKDSTDNRISVTVFSQHTRNFIYEYVAKGDLFSVSGHIQSGSYERNGQTIYTTDLIAESFNLESKAQAKKEAA